MSEPSPALSIYSQLKTKTKKQPWFVVRDDLSSDSVVTEQRGQVLGQEPEWPFNRQSLSNWVKERQKRPNYTEREREHNTHRYCSVVKDSPRL